MKIVCMRGYSGSGKSTRAAEIAKEIGGVIVNRDALRQMLLQSFWTGRSADEARVTIAEEAQVTALLKEGVPVVVDATHLNPAFLRKWARLATKLGVPFEVVDVKTEVTECLSRDRDRERSVGEKVISKQVRRFPVDRWPPIVSYPFRPSPIDDDPSPDLESAIIVDIDGTLAINTGRSPYDYSRVAEDAVDPVVRDLVRLYHESYVTILVVSGRDDTCREETLDWLADKDIPIDDLFMRDTARDRDERGKLPDFIVKARLFDDHIRGRYNVLFCLDDRKQVIDHAWRAMGLKVLDVAGNEF